MASVKWRPFCLDLNVLKMQPVEAPYSVLTPSASNTKNMGIYLLCISTR